MRKHFLLPFLALAGCTTTHEPCGKDYAALREEEMFILSLAPELMRELETREPEADEALLLDRARDLLASRTRVAEEQDLAIVRRAKVIMRDRDDWNRDDERDCERRDKGISLFCALSEASIATTGAYEHRRTAMQEVRFAIEDHSGKSYDHRLQDFNNDPDFDRGDMIAVLELAEDRLTTRLLRQAACAL